MTKILMTGASGFVGGQLLKYIPIEDLVIVGRSRPKGFTGEVFIKSINGAEDYSSCLPGVEVVIHLAGVAHNASNAIDYINNVNVNGTLNLAKQAARSGAKRFIFISSIGVLGAHSKTPFTEGSPELPCSEYTKSKLEAETQLLKLAQDTGLDVVIIRPVLVYGKNAPGNFNLLMNAVCKFPFTPFGLLKNRRSFVSIDNLCDFILLCGSHPLAANEVFLVSDDQVASTPDFINAIAIGLNKKIYHFPVSVWFLRVLGGFVGKGKQVGQLVDDLEVECTKAKKLLGWSPLETMAQAMEKLK